MVLAWGTLRHPHATSTEIPTAQMRAVSRFTYKGLQNPALVSQAAELEVKAAQLREEDYRRELSSQGECLEQRATQMDRLGKVRDLGHCIETTGFRVGRRTSTPICVQRCVTVQTLASPVMTAGRGDFTGSPYNECCAQALRNAERHQATLEAELHEQAERHAELAEDLATARHAEQETARSALNPAFNLGHNLSFVTQPLEQSIQCVHAHKCLSIVCRALEDSELSLGQALDQCKASDDAARHAR